MIIVCRKCASATTSKRNEMKVRFCDAEQHMCYAHDDKQTPVCIYAMYVADQLAAKTPEFLIAKKTLFSKLYRGVMTEAYVSFRRHKGVSSDCRDCAVAAINCFKARGNRVELTKAMRLKSEHLGVVQRARGEVVARYRLAMKCFTQGRDGQKSIADSESIMHTMLDKGATNGTKVPFIAGVNGKKANRGEHRITISTMTPSIPGVGVFLPLLLSFLQTGAVDTNLTCHLMAILKVYEKTGFLPLHFDTTFDGGDCNMSCALVLLAGHLGGTGRFKTFTATRSMVGHGHGTADGETARLARARKPTTRNGQGYSVLSVQQFQTDLMRRAFGDRFVGAPLIANTLGLSAALAQYKNPALDTENDSFSAGRHHYKVLRHLPGLTTVRVRSDDKEAEIHAIRVFVNRRGVVAFQHKTL